MRIRFLCARVKHIFHKLHLDLFSRDNQLNKVLDNEKMAIFKSSLVGIKTNPLGSFQVITSGTTWNEIVE